jgi:hypothetical protein
VIIGLRGLFAIASIAVLLAFAAYALVIDPVRETGFVPAKTFHTSDPKYDFPMAQPVWSIVAVSDEHIVGSSLATIYSCL